MANEIKRVFGSDKSKMSLANEKNSVCPKAGTKFNLTGKFVCEDGYIDRATGKRVHEDRVYCYFEGQRNGQNREGGISASTFLRRPFNGFTEEEEKQLSAFQKDLLNCENAGDLYDLFEKYGVWNKNIIVRSIVRHNEVPYGKQAEQPVQYCNFDIE